MALGFIGICRDLVCWTIVFACFHGLVCFGVVFVVDRNTELLTVVLLLLVILRI